ncbi:MAG: bifunctional metallophosphatase/5'-nucleotidase [Firmicutes bacterium]|nr:bifunctional metallophosphatase/5'-nucleotidase [Bacillota bacterium]
MFISPKKYSTALTVCLILVLLLSPSMQLFFGPAAAAENVNEEVLFTILHTNDEHSSLLPHSPAIDFDPEKKNNAIGGFARLATAIEEVRERKNKEGEPVLLFSAGDYLGGSSFAWLATQGSAPELKLLQQMGYDAVTIGNHEFDFGEDVLLDYLKEAGYPEAHEKTALISSNILAPDHPLGEPGLIKNTHMLDVEGLKIGLFGLIGETAVIFASSNVKDIDFSDQTEAAREAVAELKKQGADIIIAITHCGVDEDQQLARNVDGIDIVIGGHSHTVLEEPVIEGETIIVQTGSLLHYMGILEVACNPETGKVRLRNIENGTPYLRPLDGTVPPHPGMMASLEEYIGELDSFVSERTGGKINSIMDTIAYADFSLPNKPPLEESALGNFVADAMRLVTQEKTGNKVDFAVQANGSIRGSVIPGTEPYSLNRISFYDIVEQVGLGSDPDGDPGYPIVSFYLNGKEISRVLEIAALLPEAFGNEFFLQWSGLRFTYDPDRTIIFKIPFTIFPLPSFHAVLESEAYAKEGVQTGDDEDYLPIDPEKLYSVATDLYVLSYLPMIGEFLPMMKIVPKDSAGNPVEDLDTLIVYSQDGEQLKVWQTVVEYALKQPVGESGYPEIPSYYQSTMGRVNFGKGVPLQVWYLPVGLLLLLLVYLIIRRRKAKNVSQA